MANCYDCIHTYTCKYDRFFGVDGVENKCHYFKNKADYAEVRHGEWAEKIRWIREDRTVMHYQCSLCGVYLAEKANYCPNCGAKMNTQ